MRKKIEAGPQISRMGRKGRMRRRRRMRMRMLE